MVVFDSNICMSRRQYHKMVSNLFSSISIINVCVGILRQNDLELRSANRLCPKSSENSEWQKVTSYESYDMRKLVNNKYYKGVFQLQRHLILAR